MLFLYFRLSTEMDSAVKTTDPELIPELVAKHVQEMDLVYYLIYILFFS